MTDTISGKNGRVKSLLSLFEKPAGQPVNHHSINSPIRTQRNSYDTPKPDIFQFKNDISNAFRPVKSDSDHKEPDEITQLSDKISVKKLIKSYQSLTSPKYDSTPSKFGKPFFRAVNSIDKSSESDQKSPYIANKAKFMPSSPVKQEKILINKESVNKDANEPIKETAKAPVKEIPKVPTKEPVKQVAKETIADHVKPSDTISSPIKEKKSEVVPSSIEKVSGKTTSAESSSPITSADESHDEEMETKSYTFAPSQLPEKTARVDARKENIDEEGAGKSDEDDSFDLPEGDHVTPLPASYKQLSNIRGHLDLILPPPPAKSLIKTTGKSKKNIVFSEDTSTFNTYSVLEYDRGDQSVDPVSASAEYEIEKRLDVLDRFEITLEKDSKGLGLSILGVGLGIESGTERLGIFIKSLTPNGVAEKTGLLKVQDQILEVDGVSLVGVSQKFAADTLKGTGRSVKMIMGREKKNNEAEEV